MKPALNHKNLTNAVKQADPGKLAWRYIAGVLAASGGKKD